MKNKMMIPIAILVGLGLIAYAIYLGLTIEFRSAEKACKLEIKPFEEDKGTSNYETILSECINGSLNSKYY